ncbi:hypothetical protein [Paenirhodobacter populi]|nr:hypothetical protein [Sinirhodobacter populi]
MTRITLTLALLATLLAACGVDGPPKPPREVKQSDVSISGEARFGVSTRL